MTIKGDGNGNVKVIRYLPGKGEMRKVCSSKLAELIPILCTAGCSYSMIIKLLRDAKQNDMLNTRLVVDAVPTRQRRYSGENREQQSNRFIAGPMPDLFNPKEESNSKVARDDIAQLNELEEEKNNSQRDGLWSKMNGSLRRGESR